MDAITKTAKHAVIYAVGIFLNKIVSFVMLPIYTRYLSPKDYGTIELLSMTTDLFGLILGFGITLAIFRFYYMHETKEERNMVLSTLTMLSIALYFIVISIGVLSSGILSEWVLEEGRTNTIYFQLMFVIFFLQVLIEIPLTCIRAQEKPYLFVFVNLAKLIVQLSLNIYFIVIQNMHVLGMLYSTLISYALFSAGLIIYTLKSVGFAFNKALAKDAIIFVAPFIVTNLSEFILTFSDRYFLKFYAGVSIVGIYSLGYKMGFILLTVTATPFFSVWDYMRFKIAKDEKVQVINSRVFLIFNLILITVALGISLFSFDLFRIMSAKEFWAAYKIVPIIMIAYILAAWTAFGNFGILYAGRTKLMAYGTFYAALSIIILSFLLIPKYGMYGAAIATTVAFLVRFIFLFTYAQRLFHLTLPWEKVLWILTLAVTINIVSYIVRIENIYWSVTTQSLLWTAFIGIVFMGPFLDREDKKYLINTIRFPMKYLRT